MRITSGVWSNPRLWAISLAETLAWASLFYIFPASLIRWQMHFGWNVSVLSSALMLALMVSAFTGIASGKLIDKGFGRETMCGGTILGGVCLLLIPTIQTIAGFYALWFVIGIATVSYTHLTLPTKA